MNHTTRRHPRSLTEAFPGHYAGSLSGPHRRPLGERIYRAMLWGVAVFAVAALAAHFGSM